jgi:Fur family zinc uptake transcriptional regulator
MASTPHDHALGDLNDTQKRVHRILTAAQNPLSAYRCLDKLIEKGLAHRLESLNAYVACKHPHHHDMAAFAICESCGLVTEFTDGQLSERLSQWSDGHAFCPKKVTVEIRGLCEACAT